MNHSVAKKNDQRTSFSYTKILSVLAVTLSVAGCAVSPAQSSDGPEYEVTSSQLDVRGVGAIEGKEYTIMVPENRANKDSRLIALRFVVLEAMQPSALPPVVYLAGGPGGSATGAAQSPRWPLFDALRQNRDVILLDQRGTGLSDAPPDCISSIGWSEEDVADRDTFIGKHRMAFRECRDFWQEEGVELSGYTTSESAHDLAAISKALDTPLSLLGISYGTHLGLATMDEHPEIIDRVVLVSVEGLDQTVKLPARTDAYFERLQSALNEGAADQDFPPYPDLAEALRIGLERIERDRPVIDVFVARNQPPVKRTLGAFAVQRAISFALSDPDRATDVANGILAMAAETPDYSLMARFGFLMLDQIELRAMPTIMDMASGISPERNALVSGQSPVALLGDAPNFPMPHLANESGSFRMPDEFRETPSSDVPTLVLSGTLDARTYPEAALEATAGLTERTMITVENGGHNLFFDHPDIVPDIIAFLAGENLEDKVLIADLPKASR